MKKKLANNKNLGSKKEENLLRDSVDFSRTERVLQTQRRKAMEGFFDVRNEDGNVMLEGEAVARARYAAQLTQAEVARRMKLLGYFLPQPYVSELERGKYRWGFTERKATALAAALGVGICDITGGRLLEACDVQHIQRLLTEVDGVVGPGHESGPGSQAA